MTEKTKVVIIGAGSAGISALRAVQKITDEYIIIDNGPLGTKCARVGCMPSKALISVANDFHRRKKFEKEGILGGESLTAYMPAVLKHVRGLRDHFARAMVEVTESLAKDHLMIGSVQIISADTVRIGSMNIQTENIIIATGASPKVPQKWKEFGQGIITTDDFFELENIPADIAVIGLGAVGLEIGQALSRLGINVTGFSSGSSVAGMGNPEINALAIEILQNEFPIHLEAEPKLYKAGGKIRIEHPDKTVEVDAVIAAIGLCPNLARLGLENAGVRLDERGLPDFDRRTMQIQDLPIFIAGDADGCRPILHEAIDEGFIAGHNSVSDKISAFCRRSSMKMVFCDPQIVSVGLTYKQLGDKKASFVIGREDFSQQARAMLEQKNSGLLHIYA
ncbi:dihydrolipoyl dehydrogenase, partial [Candidatus Oleimmundimicrobium sp.]|uniref:dihydrolipoyl dehydrogenase n=1 Tax=Candidatus Oleimmundimicrobium sp. TaxID=3060597 RepID=UPI00280BEEDA